MPHPRRMARPSGYPNATNVAALVNAGWLLALNVLIAAAAVERLLTGSHRVEGQLGARIGARLGGRGEILGGLVLIGVGAAVAAGLI